MAEPVENKNLERKLATNAEDMIGKAKTLIIGVGGGGTNIAASTVLNLLDSGIDLKKNDITCVLTNSDLKALYAHQANDRLAQLIEAGNFIPLISEEMSKALGGGGDPAVGEKLMKESLAAGAFDHLFFKDGSKTDIINYDIVFVVASLGKATGTGAGPELMNYIHTTAPKALPVAVMSLPFAFEGEFRRKAAEIGYGKFSQEGIKKLILYNDDLLPMADKLYPDTKGKHNFGPLKKLADRMLSVPITTILDIITKDADVNSDYSDIVKIMSYGENAFFSVGHGKGEDRAAAALNELLENPIYGSRDNSVMTGAKGLLISYYTKNGEDDLGYHEMDFISNALKGRSAKDVNAIYSVAKNQNLPDDALQISVIATGFKEELRPYVETAVELSKDVYSIPLNVSAQSSISNQSEKKQDSTTKLALETFSDN